MDMRLRPGSDEDDGSRARVIVEPSLKLQAREAGHLDIGDDATRRLRGTGREEFLG
ncbi:MAG: hypothetical protein WDM89_02750 [Rhizomicrobium sp.]